ncbi:MAG TPA: phosphate/phosphite/phosphonate ABC transporter substrate-binding protein [Caulobacteraceae bacterium]|nr:phosphate/phosphite/phosphonate ABC transporter substrate-binding protein [Caulobacteraceae bacterium]
MTAIRRWAAALAGLALLSGCAKPAPSATGDTLNFSILSAEDSQKMGQYWQPLIDDMQKATGLKIKPFYATNYAALVEAMRFNQTQVGWFSAAPALDAVQRANAEVIGRILTSGEEGTYQSVLIARADSKITLDDVLKCGKRLNFGIGDPESTSGTLAPMAYIFVPHGIEPGDCFKTVHSASHQNNFLSVAHGLVDVATNNTVGMTFYTRESPDLATKVKVIWTSPPLPESSILVRKDLDPAIKEKVRAFFLSYGQAPGAEGDHERKILKALTYTGFQATDDSYLDPVRTMQAAKDLGEAKHTGDPAKIAAAEKAFDQVQADIAARAKAGAVAAQ